MVRTMKRIGVWAVLFSFCFIPFALADQLVTSGDYAFLADGNLKVYKINEPGTVLKEFEFEENAVAVAISGTNAVVTVDDGSVRSIKVFDVSAYIGQESGPSDCDSNTYLGTFDIEEGIIRLPGVAIGETIYTLIMERRGNSNNWEITFSEEVDEIVADDGGDDTEE